LTFFLLFGLFTLLFGLTLWSVLREWTLGPPEPVPRLGGATPRAATPTVGVIVIERRAPTPTPTWTPSPTPTLSPTPTPTMTPTPAPTATPSPTATPVAVVHIVQAGDTLWDLARRYGVSVEEITQANDLAPGTYLHIGQALRIPRTAGP
jgi:LysM repeat protein